MSPGQQPSLPSTKPRRPTTQLHRVNTRLTSLCTTRSREMSGSPGLCGQHPHSGHQSGVHPAGKAHQPEVAHQCTPRHPSVCTPWLTGLRYGKWVVTDCCVSLGAEELHRCPGFPCQPCLVSVDGTGGSGNCWFSTEMQGYGWETQHFMKLLLS
jgi:hypothetical protein